MAGYVGGIESELTYFQAALKLYDLMDVTGALDNIGVKPSSNSSYDVSFCLQLLFCCVLHMNFVFLIMFAAARYIQGLQSPSHLGMLSKSFLNILSFVRPLIFFDDFALHRITRMASYSFKLGFVSLRNLCQWLVRLLGFLAPNFATTTLLSTICELKLIQRQPPL